MEWYIITRGRRRDDRQGTHMNTEKENSYAD
jgi:hypothetical protein